MKIYLNNIFVTLLISANLITNIKANFKCNKLPPEAPIDNCCSLPNFYSAEIKEKCNSLENHFKLDIDHKHQCFISCAFDEMGIFVEGEFQKEKLDSYLDMALQDTPDIVDNIKNNFQSCIRNYLDLAKIIPTNGPCALYHVLVMDCVFIKTFQKCPDSIWSNTDTCNEVQEFWRACLPQEL